MPIGIVEVTNQVNRLYAIITDAKIADVVASEAPHTEKKTATFTKIEKIETQLHLFRPVERVQIIVSLFQFDSFLTWLDQELSSELSTIKMEHGTSTFCPAALEMMDEETEKSEFIKSDSNTAYRDQLPRPSFAQSKSSFRSSFSRSASHFFTRDRPRKTSYLTISENVTVQSASQICAHLICMHQKNVALVDQDLPWNSTRRRLVDRMVLELKKGEYFPEELSKALLKADAANLVAASIATGATLGVLAPTLAAVPLVHFSSRKICLISIKSSEDYNSLCESYAKELSEILFNNRQLDLLFPTTGTAVLPTYQRDHIKLAKHVLKSSVLSMQDEALKLVFLEKMLDKNEAVCQLMNIQCGITSAEKNCENKGTRKGIQSDIKRAMSGILTNVLTKEYRIQLFQNVGINSRSAFSVCNCSKRPSTLTVPSPNEIIQRAGYIHQIKQFIHALDLEIQAYKDEVKIHYRNRHIGVIRSEIQRISDLYADTNPREMLIALVQSIDGIKNAVVSDHATQTIKFKSESTLSQCLNKALDRIDPNEGIRKLTLESVRSFGVASLH